MRAPFVRLDARGPLAWKRAHVAIEQASLWGSAHLRSPDVTWIYWTPDGTKRKNELGGEALHGECLIML